MFYNLFNRIKSRWPLLLLIISGLLIGRTLFSANLAVSHDLEIHAARTANYYLALKQGQIPPRWAPNLNYGFGYPVFNFAYQTQYLVGAILFSITNSIELSLNLLMIGCILAGGVGIYLLALLKLKNHFSSFVIALSFMTAPYLLLGTFVRGSLGEIPAISLLPWVMVFLQLRRKVTSWWYLIFFPMILVAWFLSHQVLVMISLPILTGWVVLDEGLKKKDQRQKKKDLFVFISLFAISLLMVMWSWLPMLMEKKLIAASQPNFMQSPFYEQYPMFSRLIWSDWQYSGLIDRTENGRFTQMIGPVQLGAFLLAVMFFIHSFFEKKIQNWKAIFWFFIFFLTVFMMNKVSLPVWQLVTPLQALQHPWRLLFFAVLSATMILIEIWDSLKEWVRMVLTIFIFAWASYVIVFWAKPVATFHKPVEQWLEYHLSGDSYGELRPLEFDLGENLKNVDKLLFISADGKMDKLDPINLIWTGNKISFDIDLHTDGQVLQKTMYYPGWQVRVNSQAVDIDHQLTDWRGRITYPVSKGPNRVEVQFSDKNTVREIADNISLVGFLGWLVVSGVFYFFQMRSRK